MLQNRQTNEVYGKQLGIWLVLAILLISLCVSWGSFSSYVYKLEVASQGHSLVDYLNASVQRLVKLEIMENPSDEVIFNLDNTITELASLEGNVSEYFDVDEEILEAISDVANDWITTKTSLEQFREDNDSTSLITASECLFYHAANLTNLTSDYISNLSKIILRLELIIVIQILAAALIIGHQVYRIFSELKRNRELSASMFIDTATGLFNRSKCHEVLKKNTEKDSIHSMIVFDLNDLKKTNDTYGHRVGDELIHSFAQILKEGTKIYTQDVFIGRYGGDEFMIYYSGLNDDDIKLYLEEVAFIAEAFNEKETKFQISYAQGYAITEAQGQEITLRQLFDIADKEMYRNKVEMKKNVLLEKIHDKNKEG